jgi:hypothetical protein
LEKLIHENEAAIGGEKAHAALIALTRLQGKGVGFPGLKPSNLMRWIPDLSQRTGWPRC